SAGGSRFHYGSQLFIECSNRDIHLHQLIARKVLQNIEVAQNQTVFRDHGNGMAIARKDLKQGTSNAQLTLQGLIAVGVARQHDRNCVPVGMKDELLQQLRRILFDDDLAFKIKACTETPVLVCIACITIDTAMLTSLIGIE